MDRVFISFETAADNPLRYGNATSLPQQCFNVSMPLRAVIAALFLCLAPVVYGQTCTSVVLAPSSATAKAAGDNLNISASGTPANCLKTAVSDVPWITISFGGGMANPSTFGITVAANSSAATRTGTVTINGLAVFTVNQQGVNCSYSFQPSSATVANSAGSGTINLSAPAGCNWSAVSADGWVQVQVASGSGAASIAYTYDANPSTTSRSTDRKSVV